MSTFEDLHQNQIRKKPTFSQKIKHFWLKYGEKIILIVGIILIAGISFEAGYLKGQKNQKGSVIVSQPACAPCPKFEEGNSANATDNNPQQGNQNKTNTQLNTENQKCVFVASKNSNKYHLPTCQWATKIKPENKICFSSKEEAVSRGYQAAKCCIK
ncbi:MAG: hypothetical protein QMD77_04020 [Patescibacteria group bacterium]|nr:hypothetical protein [Patescibacteria group bacterium]